MTVFIGAMEKTETDINTPGGSPGSLENPPSSEAGPTDSGGGHLLLSMDPFKRSSLVPRSPPRGGQPRVAEITHGANKENEELRNRVNELERLCAQLRKDVLDIRAENEVLKKALNDGPGTPLTKNATMIDPDDVSGRKVAPPQSSANFDPLQTEEIEKQDEMYIQVMTTTLGKMVLAANKQKNVSMGIKDGLQELREALDAMQANRIILRKVKRNTPSLTMSQVEKTPTPSSKENSKRAATSPAGENAGTPGDKRKKTDSGEWTVVSKKTKQASGQKKKGSENASTKTEPAKTPKKDAAAVSAKRPKKKRTRVRSEAVLIRPADGKTYADVLGEIRRNVKPEETETEIRCIRQTRAGDVLLELGHKSKNREAFSSAVKKAVGQAGDVRDLVPRVTLEIMDLDSLTTEDEVCQALQQDLEDITGEMKVSLTKINSRGQRMAIVELNEQEANKLLEKTRIKVGWINCRVRRRTLVTRCFKCLNFGHESRNCKGPNRENMCYKCGAEGHKAKTCTAQAIRCVLCSDLGVEQDQLSHAIGSGACHSFRQALEIAKKNQR